MKKIGIILLLAVLTGAGMGREWSREIRMTDVGDWRMVPDRFHVAVDRNDILHIAYFCYNIENDSIYERQPIYQKFNRYGEPLMDPLIFAQVPDTFGRNGAHPYPYDICLDEDNNVHILWGTHHRKAWHSMISNEGEIMIRDAQLQNLVITGADAADMKMYIENERIFAFTCGLDYRIPDGQSKARAVVCSFDYNGAMIDTVAVLDSMADSPCIKLQPDGSKHFQWYSYNWDWYAQLDANDSIVVEPTMLEVPDYEYPLYTISGVDIDHSGRLWASTPQTRTRILICYDLDMSVAFSIPYNFENVGTGSSLWGTVHVDNDGNINDIEEMNNRVDSTYIGHIRFSPEGELLDSPTLIHDYDGALYYRARAVNFNDSEIAVIWVRRTNEETDLYMSYSIPPEAAVPQENHYAPSSLLLISAYPNPFNSSVTIDFYIPIAGYYSLKITDTQGREIWNQNLTSVSTGDHKLVWDGSDLTGRLVPSGTYFVTLSGSNAHKSTLLNVVR